MASLSFTHIRTSGTTSFALVNTRPTSLTTHRHRNRVGFLRVVADAGAKQPLGLRELDLTVTVNGLHLPNPFVIGSGPPGTNYTVMKRAFDKVWGAVIAKTICPTRAGANGSGQIIGWENIELISDRPLETMLKEFKQLKEEYPDRIHIASVMEDFFIFFFLYFKKYRFSRSFFAFFSCPCFRFHITYINTIMSVTGTNLKTLRPEPCVEGYSTPGGYSSKAVHPLALGKVMAIAKMMKSKFNDEQYSLSATGGVEAGGDAVEFILLGANTVHVCTGIMMHGYDLIKKLCDELKDFLKMHNFRGYNFIGDLTKFGSIQLRKAVKKGLQSDKDWTGHGFVKESASF
ncbi:hypothetical protein P3X46_032096 [Hevea brasiliensis]|uniref:dihydropyrimidine dehydrogenase (NADP(+)) n=1 Tax=Hevea brasiliensis TaxID=3981 RepID=A0ABQ9KNW1_HEVBR|nr:hypothetical protein P3X46_032096 [Hevea brasiliensis]